MRRREILLRLRPVSGACGILFLATLLTGLSACGGGGSGATSNTDPSGNGKATTYTVGGAITGLDAATGLVLLNGSDTLDVPANATSFTMPTAVASGGAYNVTVKVHPTALTCSVAGGAGTVNGANVTGVTVSCEPGSESLLYSFVGKTTDGAYPIGSLIQASDGNLYGMTREGGPSSSNDGTVFMITPSGTETVLHSFVGADGSEPFGSLIQAKDGEFYGMTADGGANNAGVAFKMTSGGTESVLHSFGAGEDDGTDPQGDLIQASDGNFYGMSVAGGGGGGAGYGAVFKITPTGTETTLHTFVAISTNGEYPNGSLIQASDGNFYGMAEKGGGGVGIVFKLTPGGTFTILHSFAGGTTDGAYPLGSLIQASDGNLYGMTNGGGAHSEGVVFMLTLKGAETILHSFAGGASDGDGPDGSLIQASDGNLYGMTVEGGSSGDGVIFKVTPDGAESVLYSFNGGTTDGANPHGTLVQASDGSLYGMTYEGGASNTGTIFEFD